MQSSLKYQTGFLFLMICILCRVLPAVAGVSQSIQDQYRKDYENKALFLKIPIYEEKQYIRIEGRSFHAVSGVGAPLYKVGDQLRILQIDFGRDTVKFRLGAIASQAEAEIIFQFDTDLQENFPNRETFNAALQSTFTEGLKYSDIEDAKTSFLKEEFNRSVGRMAGAASLNREFVLEEIAPLIPDYAEIQKERDSLKTKVQDISAQLTQAQADKGRLESELKEQGTELSGIKNTNASLQEKITGSESRISSLDKELRDAKRKVQDFEREIADIRNSLNLEADSNRDLTRNNAELADRITALQNDLEGQKVANLKLGDEIEDKNKEIRKLNSTIGTLTSNKNSLSSQYVKLKGEKEKLDDFALTVDALHARMVEEKTEGGRYQGQADIYLNEVRLGSLKWSIPSYLNHNEEGSGEVTFYAESIDYVQVAPEVRRLLRTLGEKLKISLDLVALSPTMTTNPTDGTDPGELGEREQFTRSWQIINKGTQDVSFLLSAHLINSSAREIPIFQKEQRIASSNPIRRIRSHLQPVPMAIGIVLGFLLFGIVGIFRRPRGRKTPPKASPPGPAGPKQYVGEKKL